MKILSIDGSGNTASVAVAEEDKILAEYTVNHKKTHSQTLLPMVKTVLDMLGLSVDDMDYIAVSNGPGSFTGLRICAATAKGLGLAAGKPMVGVKTLEALAYNYEGADCLVCPMMDARRSQVYTGIYAFEKSSETENSDGFRLAVIEEQQAVPVEEILEKVNAQGKKVVFLGDGVPVYKDKIAEIVNVPYTLAPAGRDLQSAAALSRAAFAYIKDGKTVSATELVPDYLRMSQAEREKLERGEKITAD